MPMIEEKRGWRMCSVHKRRTKQTHCYWCLKAEVFAARALLHPEDGLMNRPHVTLAMRQAYVTARAAAGE